MLSIVCTRWMPCFFSFLLFRWSVVLRCDCVVPESASMRDIVPDGGNRSAKQGVLECRVLGVWASFLCVEHRAGLECMSEKLVVGGWTVRGLGFLDTSDVETGSVLGASQEVVHGGVFLHPCRSAKWCVLFQRGGL